MPSAIVVTRDLRFTYPDGTNALQGIDFELTDGATVALLGPNGSGKTTFAHHLNGLLLGKGVVEIDGLPLTRANLPGSAAVSAWFFRIPITSFSCRLSLRMLLLGFSPVVWIPPKRQRELTRRFAR